MKLNFTFLCCLLLCSSIVKAQDGFSDLFKSSQSDVTKLTSAYISPVLKGFSNGLNGGWTSTARTLKTLRFCVRVSVSGSIVSDADKSFDVTKIGLSNAIKPTNASQTIAPTFAGSTDNGPQITITDPTQPNNKYTTSLPAGIYAIIPTPQVQLSVGLFANTDVSLRITPTISGGPSVGSVSMFGIGLKHNFAKDFGKDGNSLPFDLALAVGYTRITLNLPLTVSPETPNGGITGSTDFSNQQLGAHFSGYNVQGILSKRLLLFFTPFVALGYSSSSADIGLTGNYPFVTGVNAKGQPIYTSIANPISISSNGISGFHADAGVQLSLTLLKIYASYTAAQYRSYNVGIGLGF